MATPTRMCLTAIAMATLAGSAWADGSVPMCPEFSTLKDKACEISNDKFCETDNKATWDAKAKSCSIKLEPTCSGFNRSIVYDKATGKCVVDKNQPTSDSGVYVGDSLTFPIFNRPKDIKANVEYCVIGETEVASDKGTDTTKAKAKKLSIVPGERGLLSCKPFPNSASTDVQEVSTDDLAGTGVKRVGWTYGILMLPYKYHTRDKEFTASGQLGPFMGYRSELLNRSINYIATVAYGPITTGTGTDAKPSVKSISGLSAGIGVVGSVGKGSTPFQLGVVWGRDFVSKSDRPDYPYTGMHWFAIQLGYDWTAN